MNFLLVFIGGGLGSILRYGISIWVQKPFEYFPIATFIANILACIVLVLAVAYFPLKWDEGITRNALAIGFCGGLSTFSTFSLETFEMLQRGAFGWACLYILASVIICLISLYIIFTMFK